MKSVVAPLTKLEISRVIEEILAIDQSIEGERWANENFLVDLPGKWELSRQILTNNRITGFLIASHNNLAVHIHRLAIHNNFKNLGLGKLLLDDIQQEARQRGINLITLKVLNTNTGAIRFYERLGFKLGNQEKNNVWMELRN